MSIPPESIGFDCLITLKLRHHVEISSELLKRLISHCPVLEELVLFVDISDVIEIKAPILRSFDFTGSIRYPSSIKNFIYRLRF